MLRGLAGLFPATDVRISDAPAAANDLVLALRIDDAGLPNPEAYEILNENAQILLRGASEQALLYSVFDFLERQGVFFGIDGASYPIDAPPHAVLPAVGQSWKASPRFRTRGLLPWPDFLNCITVYNEEDFRAYFKSMLPACDVQHLRHARLHGRQAMGRILPIVRIRRGCRLSFLDSSATNRWGYLPERTLSIRHGRFAVFRWRGVRQRRHAFRARPLGTGREGAVSLLRAGFDHAARLGIKTGHRLRRYQIPDEILEALPPEAKANKGSGARFDIESRTARNMLEVRLAQLLEAYPQVDYVWLWEDEDMNWESRKTGIPLSVTPFQQAYDFLKRNAPEKRLVLAGSGWRCAAFRAPAPKAAG